MATVDSRDYALSRATILTEGYKGLLTVNGASIAAMLAFIAQISGKSEALLRASFVAVAIFVVGLAAALLVPYFRHYHSKVSEKRESAMRQSMRLGTNTLLELVDEAVQIKKAQRPHISWWLYTGAQFLSVAAFLTGFSYLAVVGFEQAPMLNKVTAKDCK